MFIVRYRDNQKGQPKLKGIAEDVGLCDDDYDLLEKKAL